MQTHNGECPENSPEQFAAWLEKATRQQILAFKDRLILQLMFYKNSLHEAETALARKTRAAEEFKQLFEKKKAANGRLEKENAELRAQLKAFRKGARVS